MVWQLGERSSPPAVQSVVQCWAWVLSELAGSKCQGFILVLIRQKYQIPELDKQASCGWGRSGWWGKEDILPQEKEQRAMHQWLPFMYLPKEHSAPAQPCIWAPILGPHAPVLLQYSICPSTLSPQDRFYWQAWHYFAFKLFSKSMLVPRHILTCGGKERKAGGLWAGICPTIHSCSPDTSWPALTHPAFIVTSNPMSS